MRHGKRPMLTGDVWEHAYCIDYHNAHTLARTSVFAPLDCRPQSFLHRLRPQPPAGCRFVAAPLSLLERAGLVHPHSVA
jgi:hypothetical protein